MMIITNAIVCDINGEPDGDCVDLSLLIPDYLSAIPLDPQATEGTDYFISIPTSGAPTLVARN